MRIGLLYLLHTRRFNKILVIVFCAAIIFIPYSRRISVRIVEIPQSTASAECFILQAVANIVIFVLQTNIGNSFRCSQSVNVISKANIYRSELHRRKLSAVLPGERITPVCQRISYRIVGYRRVAVCRQLVRPVAVAVGICRSVCRCNAAQTAPRQRIYRRRQNIASVVSSSLSPPPQAVPLPLQQGEAWRVSVFLLPQSLARQLPRRRSPHLTINLSNFTQTPQSASLTAPLQGRLWGYRTRLLVTFGKES